MPVNANIDDDKPEGTVHQDLTNGINEKALQDFALRYEQCGVKIDDLMTNAGKLAQPHIDEQKKILKEAAEQGITKQVMRAKLKQRSFERKAKNVTATLNDDQKDLFTEISRKMETLDLFAAYDDAEGESDA